MAENFLNNPTRALDFAAKLATAAVSKNPKTLLQVISLYHTGKVFYFVKFV